MSEDRRVKPFSYAEHEMIARLASEGYSPRQVREELATAGFPRNRHMISDYMKENGITTDPVAYYRRMGQPLRTGERNKLEDPNHQYIDPFDANARFAAAFEAAGGGRYRDDPMEAWKSRMSRPKEVRDYGCNHMTTGGVAVYG